MEAELVALQRPPQRRLQLQELDRAVVHAGVELDAAAASLRLRAIQRRVRVAKDVLGMRVRRAAVGDADRSAAEDFESAQPERNAQLFPQTVGDLACVGGGGDVLEQDGEFVSAQASHAVAGPQAGLEPSGNFDQELVAADVPEAVVDHLEAVDVQDQDGEAGLVPALLQRQAMLEAIEE